MTRLLPSAHTEKLGVTEVERTCALARVSFRRLLTDDVGIDGFIELFENGAATGIYIGVQIKTGNSYVSEDGSKFTFVADQDHFGYWARCAFRVIGIVMSPKYNRTVWLDLSSVATDERIINGPYSITIQFSPETEFSPANIHNRIAPLATSYVSQRRTLCEIQQLLSDVPKQAELNVPNIEAVGDRRETWRHLIKVFVSVDAEIPIVMDAGYRLSWYFPSVDRKLQGELIEKLSRLDDKAMSKIICGLHTLIEANDISPSELICDLLSYVPDIAKRVEQLLRQGKVPLPCIEAGIQAIEYIEQNPRDDLRALFPVESFK